MGFFSQCCKGCGRELLAFHAVREGGIRWMSRGVAVTPDNEVLKGFYDGYGALEHDEIPDTAHDDAVGADNEIWHEACWELAGCPAEYNGPTPDADGQGFWHSYTASSDPDPRGAAV